MNNHQNIHIPVLMDTVLHYLAPEKGNNYLDLTAGYGGHAGAVLERTLNSAGATLVDRDDYAITALQQKFAKPGPRIIKTDFYQAAKKMAGEGKQFDMILADLGVSSLHLDYPERGFSLKADGPLDMRMDQSQELSAAQIVNTYSLADLITMLRVYGEEPHARRIAELIIQHRPFNSTLELAEIVRKAWPFGSKVHPATRTFQAIRIAVNDELGLLEKALPIWIELLSPGGRIVVISFHSLEDRIVKRAFSALAGNRYDATLKLLTKSPVTGSHDEIVSNPRARSAKLRAACKIKI